jgi:pyrroline-5-carboxylate reductase
LAIIGGGNMGEALIAGLLASKEWNPADIVVADNRPEALARLEKAYKITVSKDNQAAIDKATIVLFAVKPQQIKTVLDELGPLLRVDQLVLSIAAGVTCASIENVLKPGVPVVRVMPNTPALVGAGVAGIAAGRSANDDHMGIAEAILNTVGTTVRVAEKDLDAVTALSGSGPAYVFYMAEAMRDAAIGLGLSATTADRLTRQTIFGAGKLLSISPESPQELRKRVTSPGGTTQAALEALEQGRLKTLFADAMQKAARRSSELSQGGSKA